MIKCECGGTYCQEKERMMCGIVVKSKKCDHCLRMIPSERINQEVRVGFKVYNSLFAPPYSWMECDDRYEDEDDLTFADEEFYVEDAL